MFCSYELVYATGRQGKQEGKTLVRDKRDGAIACRDLHLTLMFFPVFYENICFSLSHKVCRRLSSSVLLRTVSCVFFSPAKKKNRLIAGYHQTGALQFSASCLWCTTQQFSQWKLRRELIASFKCAQFSSLTVNFLRFLVFKWRAYWSLQQF